ncbi:transcriptional regulator [Streptomyces sp. NPDC046197]|uniref:transcriptional regulator n=1 Tax=Streptomyces sp. NPDC046197 TaxID=3154337 RepID=UPI0033E1EA33
MSEPGLDEQIHHPTRLAVVAFLSGCAEAEFGAVKEQCGLTSPTLSKLVTALEAVGYVRARKGYLGKRPRTWLSLTAEGRSALEGHLAALRELVEGNRRDGAAYQDAAGEAKL